MTMTTLRVSSRTRDEVSKIAAEEFGGATHDEVIATLLVEHHKQSILAAYERLRSDPEEWADYLDETEQWAELGAATIAERGE
jgi:hypothetical protein